MAALSNMKTITNGKEAANIPENCIFNSHIVVSPLIPECVLSHYSIHSNSANSEQ